MHTSVAGFASIVELNRTWKKTPLHKRMGCLKREQGKLILALNTSYTPERAGL